MNNEEKILEMLSQMQSTMDARFDGIDARLDGMDARFDGIDARLDNLEAGQKRIRRNIAEIKVELKKGVWVDILHLDRRISENTEAIEQLRSAR